MTIATAIDDFLLAKEAGQRAGTTLKWYRKYLLPFSREFGDVPVDSLTMRKVALWLRAQTGGEQTRYNRDKALRAFFGWSAKHFQTPNPMKAIPLPRLPEPEPRAIEPDDLNRLIDVCGNPRDVAILITLADCGFRASGLVSIGIEDVDFAARTIRVKEKGGRHRAVPFSLDTERALLAWCKKRPLNADTLFCTYQGHAMTYWGLRQVMRRLAKKAGFTDERCNLHSLRHFAAREYLKAGGSLPALARILGHGTIDTTARYYGIFSGSELAEVHDAHSPLNSLKRKDTI
jgi:site-specific recombinase XerD